MCESQLGEEDCDMNFERMFKGLLKLGHMHKVFVEIIGAHAELIELL